MFTAKLFEPKDMAAALGLTLGGRVQVAVDNAVIRYDMPYCPFRTGALARSPYQASPPGSGQVIYNTPYARYLYYNVVYGPNIPVYDDDSGVPTRFFSPPGRAKSPKVPEQSFVFSQDASPMAGAFWFQRMKADHLQDIIKEAKMAVGKR